MIRMAGLDVQGIGSGEALVAAGLPERNGVPETLNGVAYERCGSTYYKATMSRSFLVFVVSQP